MEGKHEFLKSTVSVEMKQALFWIPFPSQKFIITQLAALRPLAFDQER